MKHRKPVKSSVALALWIGSVLLSIWLIMMIAATWITAVAADRQMTQENWELTGDLDDLTRVYEWSELDNPDKETVDFWLFYGLRTYGRHRNHIGGGLLRPVDHPVQTAAVIYDGAGNLLEKNGNGLYFRYMTEESWHTADLDTYHDGSAKALFDRAEISQIALEVLQRSDVRALKLTGVLEGESFTPSRIEYVSERDFYDQLFADNRTGRYEAHKLLQEMLDHGDLEWQTLLSSNFDDPDQQVYYSVNCYASIYDPGDALTVDGKKYIDLMAYLEDMGAGNEPGFQWKYDSGTLWDRLICREIEVFENADYEAGLEYRILAAARYSPLKLAMAGLLYVYIGSFALTLIAAWVLWDGIRQKLIVPLQAFQYAMEKGWGSMSYKKQGQPQWPEIAALEQNYSVLRREREKLQDENTRLQIALNYAKEAEINRRQMTSAVAHELKTPLAVIHSYAEGLKEKIAEEKREQYLDVILSETNRLDTLVMEMLDLSRLEAGKVKLTRDSCSLSAMADQIVRRLELPAQERELQIQLDLQGDCVISADESRLLQVMENFVANAVRYTPAGGNVRIITFEDRRFVWFRVENDGAPLSKEAQNRVWESFFQTDQARSGKGSGLGLAISKNIIELHGGACRAENITNGVAFWFRLSK